MKEKLVENWLINASERGYQGPLCSLLGLEGFRVLHSTRHCAMEMGKDIIAENQSGELFCFQLKALKGKRLKLSDWRGDLQQQIYPLVMGKVVHPSVGEKKVHRSVVVVTGYLDEEVSHEIDQFNQTQIESGYPSRKIEVWTLGDLINLFTKHLEKFGPEDPADFKRWLELFLDGPKGLPDKDKLFLLIENIVSTNEPKSETQFQELIAFLMVLVGSIANQYTEEDNFAAETEIWIALYLHILYFQTTYGYAIKTIEVVRAIIFELIDSSLQKFVAEVSMRKKYSEFDEMLNPFEEFYAAQSGALICLYLLLRDETGDNVKEAHKAVLDILEKDLLKKIKLAGEVSIVYCALINLVLMKFERVQSAVSHLYVITKTLVEVNLKGDLKLPSPQYDLETVLLNQFGEELESSIIDDSFDKRSFTLRSLVYLFAKMNFRKLMEPLWKDVTNFSCEEFSPTNKNELLKRRSFEGVNWTYLFETTQSWSKLRADSLVFSEGSSLPESIKDSGLDLFCLLYSQPYRLTAETLCRLHKLFGIPDFK